MLGICEGEEQEDLFIRLSQIELASLQPVESNAFLKLKCNHIEGLLLNDIDDSPRVTTFDASVINKMDIGHIKWSKSKSGSNKRLYNNDEPQSSIIEDEDMLCSTNNTSNLPQKISSSAKTIQGTKKKIQKTSNLDENNNMDFFADIIEGRSKIIDFDSKKWFSLIEAASTIESIPSQIFEKMSESQSNKKSNHFLLFFYLICIEKYENSNEIFRNHSLKILNYLDVSEVKHVDQSVISNSLKLLDPLLLKSGIDDVQLISFAARLIGLLNVSRDITIIHILVKMSKQCSSISEYLRNEFFTVDTSDLLLTQPIGDIKLGAFNCYAILEHGAFPDENNILNTIVSSCSDVICKKDFLLSLTIDCLILAQHPEYFFVIPALKKIFAFTFKKLLSNEKTESRIRFLEIGGRICEFSRPLETIFKSDCKYDVYSYIKSIDCPSFIDPMKLISTDKSSYSKINSYIEFLSCLWCIDHEGIPTLQSEKFVAIILKNLNDQGPIVKVRCLKEFTRFISKDPLENNENFRTAIQLKLDDPSPSVRDACIDLLCKFTEDNISNFNNVLLQRINDPSNNIRKKIMKMLSSQLDNLSDEKATNVKSSLVMMSYLEPKETKGGAFECLCKYWIMPIMDKMSKLKKDFVSQKHIIAKFTSEIIQIMEISSLRLSRLGFRSFKEFYEGLCEKFGSDFSNVITKNTVNLLFETLILHCEVQDEGSYSQVKYILASLIPIVSSNLPNQDYMFLQDNLRLLSSLLRFDCEETVEYSLELVKMAFSCEKSYRVLARKHHNIIQDIFRLALRGSEKIVKTSIELLFIFSTFIEKVEIQIKDMSSRLCTFLIKKAYDNYISEQDNMPFNRSAVCRALYSIGIINRLSATTLKTEDFENVLQIYSMFYKIIPKTEKIFLFMGVSELIIGYPFQSVCNESFKNLITEGLKSDHCECRLALLTGFYNCLESKTNINEQKVVKSDADAIVFKEATLDYRGKCIYSIQTFLPEILNSISIPQSESNPMYLQLLEAAVILYSFILKKGLTAPHLILPTLLSLYHFKLADLRLDIKSVCEGALEDINESFVKISFRESIELTWKRNIPAIVDGQSCLAWIYEGTLTSICKSVAKKKELLSVIFSEIDRSDDISYVQWLILAVSELPLQTQSEISMIFDYLDNLSCTHEEFLAKQYLLLLLKTHLKYVYRIDNLQPSSSEKLKRINTDLLKIGKIDGNIQDLLDELFTFEKNDKHRSQVNFSSKSKSQAKLKKTKRKRRTFVDSETEEEDIDDIY